MPIGKLSKQVVPLVDGTATASRTERNMQLPFTRPPADGDGEAAEAPTLTNNEKLENVNPDSSTARCATRNSRASMFPAAASPRARVSDGRIRSASATTIDPGLVVDGEIADPQALGASIAEFFTANGLPNKVRMGVASPRVVIRTIETPGNRGPQGVQRRGGFQASDHIPMPLDEAVLDYQVLATIPGAEHRRSAEVQRNAGCSAAAA